MNENHGPSILFLSSLNTNFPGKFFERRPYLLLSSPHYKFIKVFDARKTFIPPIRYSRNTC